MRYSIRLIRAMCATGNAAVAQDLIDQGIVAQLVCMLGGKARNVFLTDNFS